jgi:hypothetical protein
MILFGCPFFVRYVNGAAISVNEAMNFLLYPAKPRNYLSCFFVHLNLTFAHNMTGK